MDGIQKEKSLLSIGKELLMIHVLMRKWTF